MRTRPRSSSPHRRGPHAAPATSAVPKASEYAVIVHVCSVRESPSSARMVGSAGPMTVLNICAMRAPKPMAARIAHAFRVVTGSPLEVRDFSGRSRPLTHAACSSRSCPCNASRLRSLQPSEPRRGGVVAQWWTPSATPRVPDRDDHFVLAQEPRRPRWVETCVARWTCHFEVGPRHHREQLIRVRLVTAS